MDDVRKMYEGYWGSKEGLEEFGDYERNAVLKGLFKGGEKVLDLASGEGAVSAFIKSLGCEVVAFDISEKALEKAKKRGVKTVRGNVEEKLPFKNGEFDCVFWGDNVEHLFNPEKTLKEINRVLKSGGRLIISTPNMAYWRYRIYYLVNGMVPQTEWFGENSWQWEHIRFFNRKIISDFLKTGNFRMTDFFGVSRRRLDFLKGTWPSMFGMIMIAVGEKHA